MSVRACGRARSSGTPLVARVAHARRRWLSCGRAVARGLDRPSGPWGFGGAPQARRGGCMLRVRLGRRVGASSYDTMLRHGGDDDCGRLLLLSQLHVACIFFKKK
jgi:hypothetical protein